MEVERIYIDYKLGTIYSLTYIPTRGSCAADVEFEFRVGHCRLACWQWP